MQPTSMSAFVIPFVPLPNAMPRPKSLLPNHWHTKRTRSLHMTASNPSPEEEQTDPLISISKRDWREFRASLVAGSAEALQRSKETAYRAGHWAHPLALPETGCFLASHPAYYRRSAPYLTQAVVFLTSYAIDGGAVGLVLNRPLRGNMADLERDGIFGRSSQYGSTKLGLQPVYAGGPDLIDKGVITVLHGKGDVVDVSEASQPLDGVFVGGLDGFMEAVEAERIDANIARLFVGCIRWRKGELEKEVDEGSWFCVAASPLFALKHCIQLPKPLWVEIMQGQGTPFAQIANQVYKDAEQENEKE